MNNFLIFFLYANQIEGFLCRFNLEFFKTSHIKR